MNKINISKAAYEAAKQAGEAEGMTFAAWRTAMKEKAKEEGTTTTTVPVVSESIENVLRDGETDLVNALDVQAELKPVMAKVDEAIETVNTAQAAAVVTTTVSKSKLAQAIFDAELAKQTETGVAMVRKDVIKRFIDEAGLSKAGANTYYQNIREKRGLVTKKA